MRLAGACSSGSRNGILADRIAGQIERAAVARAAAFGDTILRVNGADAGGAARRADDDLIADRHAAGQNSPGHHRPGTGKGERPIDSKAESPARRAALPRLRRSEQLLAQFRDTRAGLARHREHLDIAQRGRRQHVGDLGAHLGQPFGIDQIRLGDGHRAVRDPEQIDNRQMLGGLRHHAVIGGNDQQHEIDAGGARQHVVHEAFVARYIDETEDAAVRYRQVGKAEIDRDAARLFFLQAIGIDPGERAHQRGLAVIDMACGADDHQTGSTNGNSASLRARSISAADIEAKVGWMKESARTLPLARARNSHISAATPSCGTPAPS